MIDDSDRQQVAHTSRMLYVLFLVIVPMFLLGVLMGFPNLTKGMLLDDSQQLTLITIFMAVFGVAFVLAGFFCPIRIAANLLPSFHQVYSPDLPAVYRPGVSSFVLFRTSAFGTNAAIGFLLGLLGASLFIVLAFFTATWMGLLLTWPTEERLDSWRKALGP